MLASEVISIFHTVPRTLTPAIAGKSRTGELCDKPPSGTDGEDIEVVLLRRRFKM